MRSVQGQLCIAHFLISDLKMLSDDTNLMSLGMRSRILVYATFHYYRVLYCVVFFQNQIPPSSYNVYPFLI